MCEIGIMMAFLALLVAGLAIASVANERVGYITAVVGLVGGMFMYYRLTS